MSSWAGSRAAVEARPLGRTETGTLARRYDERSSRFRCRDCSAMTLISAANRSRLFLSSRLATVTLDVIVKPVVVL